jgi:hypothetical protein
MGEFLKILGAFLHESSAFSRSNQRCASLAEAVELSGSASQTWQLHPDSNTTYFSAFS